MKVSFLLDREYLSDRKFQTSLKYPKRTMARKKQINAKTCGLS
jgi:hypothetical protein